jgi:flagellar protein FliO/FliZ
MDALFGTTMPLAARFFIAFLVVLALIGVTAWLVRRFGASRLGVAARGRQPRLAVIDAASVDGRRRLVLIRRDNTEHLLMIGGPTDVVIEPNIVRAAAAREVTREAVREPGRLAMPAETPARVGPALGPAPEPSWQPPVSEPPPPPPPRSYRPPATEEPWLPSEPGARARPADSLTGLAAELSSKFSAPEPAPARTAAPPVTPPMMAPAMAPMTPPPSPQNDHNLAEMAQQLEAALRRPPPPESHPPVTDPLAMTPPTQPASPRPIARDIKPRFEPKFETKFEPKREPKTEAKAEPKVEPKPEPKPETKFETKFEPRPEAPIAPGKTQYDSLEEEMANLLGRPPDRS